jgi:hypothetical protein
MEGMPPRSPGTFKLSFREASSWPRLEMTRIAREGIDHLDRYVRSLFVKIVGVTKAYAT